ncbi:MAG TPA: hypothetical protein VGB98_00120 [Pyrinomonadaceae bacterium]
MDDTKKTFDCWCVLELFGHVRLAGHVTEASIGGCSFLRVDVPEREGEGEGIKLTRYFWQRRDLLDDAGDRGGRARRGRRERGPARDNVGDAPPGAARFQRRP